MRKPSFSQIMKHLGSVRVITNSTSADCRSSVASAVFASTVPRVAKHLPQDGMKLECGTAIRIVIFLVVVSEFVDEVCGVFH
jgi:hypothetical protein